MELPPNYHWEKRESLSIPGHTLHRLNPSFNDQFALVLYYREEDKWLYTLPFGELAWKEINSRKDWTEMPPSISSLEDAKAYVETLWRLA